MNNEFSAKWYHLGKKPVEWEQFTPRKLNDERRRVRRETLRGKLTFFHESVEDYVQRQLKAHTALRTGIVFAASAAMFKSCK